MSDDSSDPEFDPLAPEVSTQPAEQRALGLWRTLIGAMVERRAQAASEENADETLLNAISGDYTALPVVKSSELLEVYDTDDMNKGARFRTDCSGAIMEVEYERIFRDDDAETVKLQADEWAKKGADRYITECYVPLDADRNDIFVTVLGSEGEPGRTCTLADVYDECNPDQIHTPGELPLTSLQTLILL